MTASNDEQNAGLYAPTWDAYVSQWDEINASLGNKYEWPGDEWGTPETWESIFRTWFVPSSVHQWGRAIEIGQGSGKYTIKVLENSAATIRAYDISAEYQKVCAVRCKDWIEQGRLSLHTLSIERPQQMFEEIQAAGWHRTIDAFYSIDAMVHVDLQYMIAYLLTAGLTLKPGGKLILTLADVTTRNGFLKLLGDIQAYFPLQGKPSPKFEWLSPSLVQSVLLRLGFEIDILAQMDRDMYLSATLVSPDMSNQYIGYLVPQTPAPDPQAPPDQEASPGREAPLG